MWLLSPVARFSACSCSLQHQHSAAADSIDDHAIQAGLQNKQVGSGLQDATVVLNYAAVPQAVARISAFSLCQQRSATPGVKFVFKFASKWYQVSL
jgi:hypothetical protein